MVANKIQVVIRSFVHKAVRQLIIVSVLLIMAAILLNIWMVTAMDYKENYYPEHDRLNSEHIVLHYTEL